jgi:hypothetical protein
MTSILRPGAVALILAAVVPFAQADNCTGLAGKTMCVNFKYSTGGGNSLTAVFGADGSFNLPDVPGTTGTYSCAGSLGLVDVEYMYGGFEQQTWYARAGTNGNSVKGNAKSITNGYMYTLKGHAGACADSSAKSGGARQDR